jgi:5-methylcytosine-specific restriction protein A
MTKQYNQYLRDPATVKRYGAAWKKIRAAYIAANPLCEICKRSGKLTPATLVHHKIKLSDGGTNDWRNLMSLCDACHSRLHAEQGDYF